MQTIESIAERVLSAIGDDIKQQAAEDVANAEAARWNSGDLSAVLVDEFENYPKSAVRYAVALLYECSEFTIRDREYVCRTVSPELRSAHPELTFGYWYLCCKAPAIGHHARPEEVRKLEGVLTAVSQIEAHIEAYGKKPSWSMVLGWVKGMDEDEPMRHLWQQRVDRLVVSLERIQYDSRAPQELRDIIGAFMAHLDMWKEE